MVALEAETCPVRVTDVNTRTWVDHDLALSEAPPSETTHPGFRRCGLGVSRSTIYDIPVVSIVYTPTTAMNRTALSLFRASKKWAKFSSPAECAAVRGQTQGIDQLV